MMLLLLKWFKLLKLRNIYHDSFWRIRAQVFRFLLFGISFIIYWLHIHSSTSLIVILTAITQFVFSLPPLINTQSISLINNYYFRRKLCEAACRCAARIAMKSGTVTSTSTAGAYVLYGLLALACLMLLCAIEYDVSHSSKPVLYDTDLCRWELIPSSFFWFILLIFPSTIISLFFQFSLCISSL